MGRSCCALAPWHPPAHSGLFSPPPCGAWEGWQRAAEEQAALQACRREENRFFALFFPLQCPSPIYECRDLKGLCPGAILLGSWQWGWLMWLDPCGRAELSFVLRGLLLAHAPN